LAGDGPLVTARFENSRGYENHLSDALMAVNEFNYKTWPDPSAPVVYTVEIFRYGGLLATQYVTRDDLVDISGLGAVPDAEGKIGQITYGGGQLSPFYLYTPITGDCAIALN
jgi:hypothetical protein